MDWIKLLGAVGCGAIVTKLLDYFWLTRRAEENERMKWIREKRLEAYSRLAEEVNKLNITEDSFDRHAIRGTAATAMLLASTEEVSNRIESCVNLIFSTHVELGKLQSDYTTAYSEMNENERKKAKGDIGDKSINHGKELVRNARELMKALRLDLHSE